MIRNFCGKEKWDHHYASEYRSAMKESVMLNETGKNSEYVTLCELNKRNRVNPCVCVPGDKKC